MKRPKNTKPKAKPNGWEEFLRKFIVILEGDFGIYKDKKGKWRFSLEGYNFDFERQIKKLEELYSQAILSAEESKVKDVEIIKDEDDVLTDWYQCPECLRNEFDSYVRQDFIFCPWCGVKVKWVGKSLSLPDQEQLEISK